MSLALLDELAPDFPVIVWHRSCHQFYLNTAALKLTGIDAAYSIQQEEEVGSIEVGKRANLTILAQSPYDVAASELKDIAVWGTMLEGRVQPAPAVPAATAATEATPASLAAAPVDAEVRRAAVQQLAKLLSLSHDH